MVPPLMKLLFVKGPREGDSLGYKPGSIIRIGRIVRGNDITIKDAGISSKHIRIVSDSENWIIHDLGSSNGTFLNSETLDPDTPVNLSHGDVIKLGEYTSFVVNFENNVQPEEHKLLPKPRRNNRRQAVVDPDPDPNPDPTESVQEKPKRRGRPPKQNQNNLHKRTLEEDNEKEIEVENEEKVNSRVSRSRKNVAITTVEEVPVEKKENPRAQRGKNTKSVQNLDINSIKLETEETPEVAEVTVNSEENARVSRSRKNVAITPVEEEVNVEKKGNPRAQRGKNTKNVQNLGVDLIKLETEETPEVAEVAVNNEENALEEKEKEKRTSRATRSNKKEIGGDSFLELEMILKQARTNRGKKKKIKVEPLNNDVEEENEAQKSDKEDETYKSKEAGIETSNGESSDKKIEHVSSKKPSKSIEVESLNNDVEEEEDMVNEAQKSDKKDETCKRKEIGIETSNGESSDKNVEKKVKVVDLENMELVEWFDFMKIQLREQIVEETDKMFETMRIKTQRVHNYIAEQKQAKGKRALK